MGNRNKVTSHNNSLKLIKQSNLKPRARKIGPVIISANMKTMDNILSQKIMRCFNN